MTVWWAELLHPFAQDVGSVVPPVFEAYARVFHPVDGGSTWAAVAAANGRAVHAEMQFHAVARPAGSPAVAVGSMDDRLSWGSLPSEALAALAEVLAPHTSTPDACWACVWEGYAGVDSVVARDAEPVRVPGRSYRVVRTSLGGVVELAAALGGQSPNVWWPDDRAWLVATEVDHAWTYVGGTGAAVEAVLVDARLEALPASVSERFTSDADTVNS